MGAGSIFYSCFPCGKETDIEPEYTEAKVITSSKDGANFEYRDGVRYQNEAEVGYLLPNNYDGKSTLQYL